MRRKSGSATADLRSFLERAAAKKGQPDPENVTPSIKNLLQRRNNITL